MTRKQPASVPGYRIRIEGFLPANPDDISSMSRAADEVKTIKAWLDTSPLAEIMVWHKFVARHRVATPAPAGNNDG